MATENSLKFKRVGRVPPVALILRHLTKFLKWEPEETDLVPRKNLRT